MQLDQLAQEIDDAFGVSRQFTQQTLSEEDKTSLDKVFGDEGFQIFLQDEVNRQIIKNYLLNALLHKQLSVDRLPAALNQVRDTEGRTDLAMRMLVMSIHDAETLIDANDPLNKGAHAQNERPKLTLVAN